MAASSSFQRGERRGRWGSPERTVVWTEPKPKPRPASRVGIVYYLCHRDGHLDHPHFLEMELPLSSDSHRAPGLYLRDFTARLNALRGNGMPAMYSWSSKRSYKNGYVWQDLTDDDLIHPAHGNDEYVLKGSPLLFFPQHQPPPEHQDRSGGAGRRRGKNWSSFDLGDCDNELVLAQQSAAATRTDHHRGPGGPEQDADPSIELAIDEISPPPSSSSPDEGLESCSREAVGVIAGGRMRASAVLMQLFSCGSLAAGGKRGHARTRFDLVATSAGSSRRGAEKEVGAYAATSARAECLPGDGPGVVERDYFSGSLVESSKNRAGQGEGDGDGDGDGALFLKRSSSCNADRGAAKLKLKLSAAAKDGRAGCLASRGSRAPKEKTTKPTAAEGRDRVEWKGATADGAGST